MYSAFCLLIACSVDVLAFGKSGRGSYTQSTPHNPSQNPFSFGTSSPPLPTINEHFPHDTEEEESEGHNHDSSSASSKLIENGKWRLSVGSAEDLRKRVRCLPKVTRSVSFGFNKAKPKVEASANRLSLSSVPDAPISTDMMELLLPAISVEDYEGQKMQQR